MLEDSPQAESLEDGPDAEGVAEPVETTTKPAEPKRSPGFTIEDVHELVTDLVAELRSLYPEFAFSVEYASKDAVRVEMRAFLTDASAVHGKFEVELADFPLQHHDIVNILRSSMGDIRAEAQAWATRTSTRVVNGGELWKLLMRGGMGIIIDLDSDGPEAVVKAQAETE